MCMLNIRLVLSGMLCLKLNDLNIIIRLLFFCLMKCLI